MVWSTSHWAVGTEEVASVEGIAKLVGRVAEPICGDKGDGAVYAGAKIRLKKRRIGEIA